MKELKPRPNHKIYLETLKRMTPEQKVAKMFELSAIAKELFFHGLRKRFPEKTEAEIKDLYLQRIAKCYNRNY